MRLIIAALPFCFNFSQGQTVRLVKSIAVSEGEALAGIDKFQSVYTFKGSVVLKRDSVSLYQYQNLKFGAPTAIDVQNPLKPILFYKDFNAAVLLDNLFNEIEIIDFQSVSDRLVVKYLANAAQNNIWLFNEFDQKIYRYDLTSKKLTELTQNLRLGKTWFGADLNNFYWVDLENEIWKMNFFGRSTLVFASLSTDSLFLLEDYGFIYAMENQIFIANTNNKEINALDLQINDLKSFAAKGQNLAIFTNGQITIYYLKLP